MSRSRRPPLIKKKRASFNSHQKLCISVYTISPLTKKNRTGRRKAVQTRSNISKQKPRSCSITQIFFFSDPFALFREENEKETVRGMCEWTVAQ